MRTKNRNFSDMSGRYAVFMANKLMVQEQEATRNLTALGWGIRRIARQLKVSRNTVRNYVPTLEPPAPDPIAEPILKSAALPAPGPGIQPDPLSTPAKRGGRASVLSTLN